MNPVILITSACLLASFATAAAIIDVRTRRIPNWLTVSGLVVGVLFQTAISGWSGLGMALAGFATGFGILLVLWLIGGGGGGDVKLMGAIGAWVGPLHTLYVFFLSTVFVVLGMVAILGGLMLVQGYSQVRRRYLVRATAGGPNLNSEESSHESRPGKRRVIPYALPVACATWLVAAWQLLIQLRLAS